MPTYQYVCSKCEHEFDLFQSMSEEAIKVCPKEKCAKKPWGKGKVKRSIGAGAGLIFKGSGFYITDYRSDSYKEAAKKDASAANGTTATASTDKSGGGSGSDKQKPGAPAAKPETPKKEKKRSET